ncbi:MAG: CHAT domain-containing protein [Tessaracoccus sp.]|uniref:CHAT domain-containing protein n=1 Tax=Tessaracoccus sp. TaxID=1971211 RepID=UPI001EB6230D|nr:CHAT domain-containing protein [Tessaracoccus sp.]MBK7820047.1 CHAT domain-containing protein [Tessaracoccus sp.]
MRPAQELHAQARTALEEQRIADADALLRRAVALCGPGEERLRVRLSISAAWVAFEREGLDAALAASADAQAAARREGFAELAAAAAAQAGTMRARAGELEAAWRTLTAVDTAALTEEDRMRTLINRGTLASELRHLDDATADLAAAAELAAAVGAAPLESMARHNLGWLEFLRGDLPAALAATARADEIDVPFDRTVARLDRARVMLEAGLIPEARALLRGIIPPRGSCQTRAELDHELARAALLLGLPDEAVTRARAAARRFAARGEPALRRRSRLIAVLARPTAHGALALWREASEVGDRWVAPEAAAIALATLSPDDPRRAVVTRAARGLAQSPVTSRRLAGLVALAADASARGDRTAARRRLRAAHATLLRAQLGVASLDLRAAVALHGEAAALLDIGLAGDSVSGLIDATERWRAATRPVPRVHPLPDPRLADAASRLRRLRAETPTTETLAQLADAEQELRTLSWTAESRLPPMAVTLPAAQLRRAVREAGARLAVVVPRGGEFWAAVTDGHRGHLVRLGEIDQLESLVSAVHSDLAARAHLSPSHPLSAVVDASLAARLQALSDAVGAPLASTRPLVITPSRILTSVPWLALPALRGRPVTVAPTASSWATGAVTVTRPRVAALGGPDLPSAAAEVDGVLALWRGDRPGTLAGALASSDLVHVAAHGRHRSDSPLFSSLRLDEGTVVAHELEGVEMRASHVVLSACEVGRASHRPGDQPLGLTATLLASGVGCVVAPVSPVGDRTSAAVMARYHEELARGADAATALARATEDRQEAGVFACFGSSWRVD